MESKNYYDLTATEKNAFFAFLDEASKETSAPAHINMCVEGYEDQVHTLLYILEKTDRFKNGNDGIFQILFDGNKIAACSGAYRSSFCSDLALLGVRTWIHKSYRNQLISREFLLPYEKKWAIENDHKALGLTFNEYNKNLMLLWNKIRFGEHRTSRQSHHFGYNGVHRVDFLINIQYTMQYIIYEKLDPNWSYNWESLRQA